VGCYDEYLNMDSNLPFISVIVPALNEEQTIRECLVSLGHLSLDQELHVDNFKTSGTMTAFAGNLNDDP